MPKWKVRPVRWSGSTASSLPIAVNVLGYPNFFIYTAMLSLPSLLLLYLFANRADVGRLRSEA